MTQLVKKDSSWRTLRRKAVVGASSFALVAGMGVALAPVASAATTATPIVTVSAPEQTSNAGDSAAITVNVKNTDATAANTLTLTGIALVITPPAGSSLTCSAISVLRGATALTPSAGAPGTCVFPDATGSPAFGAINGGANQNYALNLKVTSTSVTGALKIVATATDGTTTWSSSAVETELVAPGAPTVETGAPAAPVFGSAYNAKVVSSAGFPPAVGAGYWAKGYQKNTDGDWVAVAPRQAINASNPYVDSNDVEHYYISLDDTADTVPDVSAAGAATTVVGGEGFFFDTATGSIVFGTVTAKTAGAGVLDSVRVSPKPVSMRGAAKITWTIVVNNGKGGAPAGGVAADAPKPALLVNDVASAQFNLTLPNFSDVSDDNVFKSAISALNNAGIIQGYADGTFGVAQNITRGEFAKAAFKIANKIRPVASAYDCQSTDSTFTDVSNTNVFCSEINTLASLGIVNGTSATTFAPNAKITRDQIAAFIFRINAYGLGSVQVGDAPQAATQFTDVPASNIFSGDIKWGTGNGIINGRTATTYDPAGNTLRQEAAGLLFRLGSAWSLF